MAIIIIALAFRIPFLLYSFGLGNSDSAIPAIMAKHISEGNLPPIWLYGALYMGSLAQHFYAIMVAIFGYSIFLIKFSSVILYIAFITVQFFFIKDVFSFRFSLIISIFYSLPIGHLIGISFDNSGAYSPLVLLLGSAIVYTSYLICYKNKEGLIPFLGFLIGISFWAHQITTCFILTSFIILLFKFKLHLKRYLSLLFFIFLGSFPLFMSEVYWNFRLLKFLFAGEMRIIGWDKLKAKAHFTLSLLNPESHPSDFIFLILLFFGLLTLIYFSLRARRFVAQSIFSLFFILFFLIYLLSRFSDINVYRYLYPAFFCLPVLLLSVFLFIRARIKYVFMFTVILFLFFFHNLKDYHLEYLVNKKKHIYFKQIVDTMRETGEKYWRGNYWTSYFITSLAKEDVIVDSSTVNRYFPYKLLYYNQNNKDNLIFLRTDSRGFEENQVAGQVAGLIDFLEMFGIEFKKKMIEGCWLIYGIKGSVSYINFKNKVNPQIPELILEKVESSKGFLYITFKNETLSKSSGFRLHIEIPEYSSFVGNFSSQKEEIRKRIPFPKRESFKIKYYLDYMGIQIPSTFQEISYSPTKKEILEERPRIVYLSGFSPFIVETDGGKRRICEKEVKIEINNPTIKNIKVRLHLYSPFQFFIPFWYGEYFQEVKVDVNNVFLMTRRLEYEKNIIEVEMKDTIIKKANNIITLKFKYHFPYSFARFFMTSAILDKIEMYVVK